MGVFTDAYELSVIGRHCNRLQNPARTTRRGRWALAVLSALLGGATGLAPLTSLISVQPLDETGNPTPAWSLKVHVKLVVVTLTATVPVLVLVTASAGHLTWLSWRRCRPGGDWRGAGRLPRRSPLTESNRRPSPYHGS
jgi:hypothetical protein